MTQYYIINYRFIMSFLLFLISTLTYGQKNQINVEEFDKKIEALIEAHKAVGLSVAVVKDNKVIYSKGFGYRDLASKRPVTENTVFHIASMTKAFSGALLGILESENQLSLTDKPSLYIPNFRFYNEKMDNLITIEDLLSHKSGIGNQGSSIVMFPEKDKLKTVQRLKYLKPEGEIKNSWIYSNIGYTLAGTVAEQVTGKSWDTNIQERLFAPLDMDNSYTTIEAMTQTDNYALGYAMYKGEIKLAPFENYYSWTPAGAIKSSVKDLTNWMLVWLNNGMFNDAQVIPKEYVKRATTLQNTKVETYEKDAFLYGEGFGWRLRAWHGHYRFHHGGNTNGFSTVMNLFPFENIGIVVLTNQKSSLLPYAVSDYISRKLYGLSDFEFPIIVSDTYQPSTENIPLNTEKMPTHSIPKYVGTYHAKGFGTIQIIQEGEHLFAVLPTYKFQLIHRNHDSFYLRGMKGFSGEFDPEFTVQFVTDKDGEITVLKLYSQREPVDFFKQ